MQRSKFQKLQAGRGLPIPRHPHVWHRRVHPIQRVVLHVHGSQLPTRPRGCVRSELRLPERRERAARVQVHDVRAGYRQPAGEVGRRGHRLGEAWRPAQQLRVGHDHSTSPARRVLHSRGCARRRRTRRHCRGGFRHLLHSHATTFTFAAAMSAAVTMPTCASPAPTAATALTSSAAPANHCHRPLHSFGQLHPIARLPVR